MIGAEVHNQPETFRVILYTPGMSFSPLGHSSTSVPVTGKRLEYNELTRSLDTTRFSRNQLMGKLLHFWASGEDGIAWTYRISDMIDIHPAWNTSMFGAAMLYNREALGREACRRKYVEFYIKGLQHQRTKMQSITDTTLTPTFDDILHTMVLIYTEAMCITSSSAILYHMNAAAHLLERNGPEKCKTGLQWRFFRDFRLLHVST